MDTTFNLWLGVVVISIVGTLAHFLYDWTNHNKIIGLFAAVNESTWEHIKIALTPAILWSLYDGFLYGENENYYLAKLLSLFVIVLAIPLMFYTYKKIAKKDILILDIAIFYIAIISNQFTFYAILNLNPLNHIFSYLACIGLFIFFGCYMTLTLAPLHNFLFLDPITNRYGFNGHNSPFKHKKKK